MKPVQRLSLVERKATPMMAALIRAGIKTAGEIRDHLRAEAARNIQEKQDREWQEWEARG